MFARVPEASPMPAKSSPGPLSTWAGAFSFLTYPNRSVKESGTCGTESVLSMVDCGKPGSTGQEVVLLGHQQFSQSRSTPPLVSAVHTGRCSLEVDSHRQPTRTM